MKTVRTTRLDGAPFVLVVGRAASAAEKDGAAAIEFHGETVYVLSRGGELVVESAMLHDAAWQDRVERILARRAT